MDLENGGIGSMKSEATIGRYGMSQPSYRGKPDRGIRRAKRAVPSRTICGVNLVSPTRGFNPHSRRPIIERLIDMGATLTIKLMEV